MEGSALVTAQTHARKAAQETARSRLGTAGGEHVLAAQHFLKAAEETEDVEALRILKLLEDHHHKLAQIVKAREEFSRKSALSKDDTAESETADHDKHTADAQHTSAPTVHSATFSERGAPPTLHKTPRDAPSSLAKDIASRRGIPPAHPRRAQPPANPVSPVQATGRITHTPPAATRALSATASEDDSFSRFYSSLLTGPVSKLSSMLAFAGLPLHETPAEESTSPSSSRLAAPGPDVSKLISRAALSALDQSRLFHPGESFYVIPPSGGTASYATMLSRNAPSSDPQPSSISSSTRHPTPSVREEELATENAALKAILNNVATRLQAFESHAQDASIALAQSVHRPREEGDDRVKALEARLEAEIGQRLALEKENARNRAVVAKYRSHWEQLKDSARARREKEGK